VCGFGSWQQEFDRCARGNSELKNALKLAQT